MKELREILDEPGEIDIAEEGSPDFEIETEPELYVFDFLELQCYEHQIGKAMAIRNYWAWKCLQ